MKRALVVLAAGMGSRYGGLKQIDPVGPSGEAIIDYSVYDAMQSGFGKVVFVLREEIVEDFYELFANRYKKYITVDHVVQSLTDIPAGVTINSGRVKPWGTGHAVMMASGKIGKVTAAHGTYGHNGPSWSGWFYQKGGGSLYDLGVYNVTTFTGLLGPVKLVPAQEFEVGH